MLHNRLQGSFVSKNVMNLFRLNLGDSEMSLLSEVIIFVPTSNTRDKSKLKKELETLGRILYYDYSGILEMKKTSLEYTFNPRNKDPTVEIYMSSLEEKLMKTKILKNDTIIQKYNNLTSKERVALCDLENDKKIVIKGVVKGSAVVA